LEKRHIVANAQSVRMRNGDGESAREITHTLQAPVFAVFLSQNVLLRKREKPEALLWRSGYPFVPIKPVKQRAANVVLFQHRSHGFVLINGGTSGAPTTKSSLKSLSASHVSILTLASRKCEAKCSHFVLGIAMQASRLPVGGKIKCQNNKANCKAR